MTAPIWLTGFECGVAAITANGGGLCDAVVGSCTITNALPAGDMPRAGQYTMKSNASGATMAYITRNLSNPTVVVVRFYFQFETAPIIDTIFFSLTTTGHKIQLSYKASDKKFYLGVDGALTQSSSATSIVTWYRLELRANVSANPWLVDWAVDGANLTQVSYAHAAEVMTALDLGQRTTSARVAYYDDVIVSVTAADYPIGDGGIIGLRPNAEGVHNNAAGVLTDNFGHTIDGVTYTAFSLLDDKPWVSGSADYVKQMLVGAANYLEVQFEDIFVSPSFVAVAGLLQYMASGTTADTGGCVIRDAVPTETELWGKSGALQDYSETSSYYKFALISVPAGGWDSTKINALRCRLGYSDNVTTKPYWTGVILEVAYKVPDSSITQTNAIIDIENKDDIAWERLTNASVDLESRDNIVWVRITNAAIMVEWVPPGRLPEKGTQVI